MDDQQRRRLVPIGLIAGFSVLVLATGSGVAWWTWKSAPPNANNIENPKTTDDKPPTIASDTTKPNPTAPSAAAPSEQTLQVYWLTPTDTSFELTPRPVQLTSTTGTDGLLEAAVQQLLAGPSNTTLSTTVPAGTTLQALTVKPDGIHLDLSQEFTQGGGSAAMTGRLAQVLYTVTSLDPKAPVWLSVDGKLIETLGGEGLVLEQPMTREQFQQDFSL